MIGTYNDGYSTGLIPESQFKISPSGLHSFLRNRYEWYKTHILGEDAFVASTGSKLGTLLHHLNEQYLLDREVTFSDINEYIESLIDMDNIDTSFIINQYPIISKMMHKYLDEVKQSKFETEKYIIHQLTDNVLVSGSVDLIQGHKVIDYKYTQKKPRGDKMSFQYWIQTLTYAYILNKQGYNITEIELWYMTPNEVLKTKTNASARYIQNHIITQDDLDIIENILYLCADTMEHAFAKPEDSYILFCDYRLKHNPPNFSRYTENKKTKPRW